jgi:hypothetical protein
VRPACRAVAVEEVEAFDEASAPPREVGDTSVMRRADPARAVES